ncbi:MAG: hypothetical protein ACKPHU_24155 [Planctomycetaceae bacterium]
MAGLRGRLAAVSASLVQSAGSAGQLPGRAAGRLAWRRKAAVDEPV